MTMTMDLGTISISIQELINQLAPGDEVVFTRNNHVVARLSMLPMPSSPDQNSDAG